MNRIAIATASVGLTTLLCGTALPQPRLPHSPSDQEMRLLPQECQIFLKGTPQQKNALSTRLPGLVGPNHYCWGLNFMNRAKFASLNREEKRFNLQSAIGEFGYVIRHSTPDATGLPKVKELQREAETMLKLL